MNAGPPAAPGAVTALPSSRDVLVSFEPVAGVAEYVVEVSGPRNATVDVEAGATAASVPFEFSDWGDEFTFVVRAAGGGPPSLPVVTSPLGRCFPSSFPAQPRNFTVAPAGDGSSAALSWNNVAFGLRSLLSYEIYQRSVGEESWGDPSATIRSPLFSRSVSATLDGLDLTSEIYNFRVVPRQLVNTESFSGNVVGCPSATAAAGSVDDAPPAPAPPPAPPAPPAPPPAPANSTVEAAPSRPRFPVIETFEVDPLGPDALFGFVITFQPQGAAADTYDVRARGFVSGTQVSTFAADSPFVTPRLFGRVRIVVQGPVAGGLKSIDVRASNAAGASPWSAPLFVNFGADEGGQD